MDLEMLLRNGSTVTLDVRALRDMLVECATVAVEIERKDFFSKKECIKELGGRRVVDMLVEKGVLVPNSTGDGKWKVPRSQVRHAKQDIELKKLIKANKNEKGKPTHTDTGHCISSHGGDEVT